MTSLIGHKVTLYAWAVPVGLTDHTWVTDYDLHACLKGSPPPYTDIEAVKRADKHYWYCSDGYMEDGVLVARFHPGNEKGTRFLGKATAILERAMDLVAPNKEHAGGTISDYGLDGTCHQIANQVLAATAWRDSPDPAFPPMIGSPPAPAPNWPPIPLYEPLTVREAKNYWASEWSYGTYGRTLTEWNNLLEASLAKAYVLEKEKENKPAKERGHRHKSEVRIHV